MAKKANNKKRQQHELEKKTEQAVDAFARVLQIVAIIAVVAIFIVNGALENADVPIYVPAGLLGVAVGLSPSQIGKIITDLLKAFVGKK